MRVVDSLQDEEFSVWSALGGWRGTVESVAPIIVFVATYIATHELTWPLIASGILAGLFVVARLVSGQQITQALSGAIGVALSCVWVVFSGRGQDFFIVGIVTAAVLSVALLVSIVLRRPAVELVLNMFWEKGAVPRRVCTTLTWVWFALFFIRFAVQVPLWWAGQIAGLGVAKLVLGLPLFAVACWITWMTLRPFVSLASVEERSTVDNGVDEPQR